MKLLSSPSPLQSLVVDASYRNTNNPHHADDQFNRFFRFGDEGINNTSGFRPKKKAGGSTDIEACAFCVLVTGWGLSEWPDTMDAESGLFTYFGDNRKPGRDLHGTLVGGNRLLRKVYDGLHVGDRAATPPFFVFESYSEPSGVHMRFLGLAAPGAMGLSAFRDLVAVWRVKGNKRFQNYQAVFTIMNEPVLERAWLEDMVAGVLPADSPHCPPTWKRWVKTGLYTPLVCERTQEPRSLKEQLPHNKREQILLDAVVAGLTAREFEFASADIVQLMDESFTDMRVTRGVGDHGRDAVGRYRVGHANHQVHLEAIVEAKKWAPKSRVGVEPMARLISRLKHRDIGVFVTTGAFAQQVQEEVIEDRHPVIMVTGGDIARILIACELDVPEKLEAWLAGIRQKAKDDTPAP